MNLESAYAWTAVAVDSCGGSGSLDVARAHTILRKHLEAVYGSPTVPWVQTPALAGVQQHGNPAGQPPPKWARDVAARAKAGAVRAAGSVAAASSKLKARLLAARAILEEAKDLPGAAGQKARAGLAAIGRALGSLARKAQEKVAAGAAAGAAAVEKVLWYQSIGVGLALLAGALVLKSIFGGSRKG